MSKKTSNAERPLLRLRRRRGGLNFIELVIGLLIISIASVATMKSFYVAYNELNRQRWRMKAIQHLKAEAEYWKARLHGGLPANVAIQLQSPPHSYEQWTPNPQSPIVLDHRGPGTFDDVYAVPGLVSIKGIDRPMTPVIPDWYEVHVKIEYVDPQQDDTNSQSELRFNTLNLYMPFIPAAVG